MRPLSVPNLPAKNVRLSALQAGPFAAALRLRGIETVSPAQEEALAPEERAHADMLLCHTGGGDVFLAPEQRALAESLKKRGFSVCPGAALTREYPGNIRYNVAVGGDFVLGRFDCTDPGLLERLSAGGRRLLPVRQGYAKCSLCFVSETAMITEDAGIAEALASIGKDVLLLSAGDVYLSGSHYGFFGGAAGLISPHVLAVTGALSFHRDGRRIRAFLEKYNVIPVELSDGKITDIGGILPLMEE